MFSLFLWPVSSCSWWIMRRRFSSALIIFRNDTFLLFFRKKWSFWILYRIAFVLKMLNFFRDMRSDFFKWNKYVVISMFFWSYFSFFLKDNSSTTDIEKIRTQFNSIFMKFSMFDSLIVFFRFFSVKNRLNKSSAASCFFFKMCLTSKSNSLIQAIHFVINASNKSIFDLFNCVTNISAFVFSTKCTSYNQYRIFFSVFSTL